MTGITVKKRNGKTEPFLAEKINEQLDFVCEGLSDVSASNIALKAHIHLFDGIETEAIQEALISAALDLTSENSPNYNIVAGRLKMNNIRKNVYGQFDPVPFYDHIYENISLGVYDKEILEKFTKEEIEFFESHIDHDLDMMLPHPSVLTWEKKYLIKNRVTQTLFETPQFANMLISMCLFSVDGVANRNEKIVKFYKRLAEQKISLPSPIMAGVRSPTKQFSSCCLIDADDSLDSINAAGNSIVKYASKRAGIGINGGRIRAVGSPVRGGEISHTGCINFYKKWQGDLHSCSQGGLRTSAATLYFPWWHYEFSELVVLKNNKGTDSNRVRHLDYAVQLNGLIYERYLKNQDVTLFSPSANRELYEFFFRDQEKFKQLYEQMESARHTMMHKVKSAHEIIHSIMMERAATGRIYIHNVDHTNVFGPFDETVAPVYMSNLCVEICLPTKPFTQSIHNPDDQGEIALCTLAAANLGTFDDKDHSHFEETADLLVEALDNLLDYQEYPVLAAEKNKKRRTLGIGIVNYSYWLAKHKAKYSDGSGNNITHRLFEAFQYYLLKASNKLAMEKGACEWFHETKYAKGSLPIDRYKKDVDSLHSEQLHMDWEFLRENIKKYGLRNSTLTALMPSETSSIISSATNGVEPQRGPMTIKSSKDGSFKFIVPEYQKLKQYYEFVWDIPNNIGYLSLMAIMQKFVDQAISTNTNYDPKRYPNDLVPMKEIVRDLFFAFKHGLKTMYYHNTRDNRGKDSEEPLPEDPESEDDGCSSGACKI